MKDTAWTEGHTINALAVWSVCPADVQLERQASCIIYDQWCLMAVGQFRRSPLPKRSKKTTVQEAHCLQLYLSWSLHCMLCNLCTSNMLQSAWITLVWAHSHTAETAHQNQVYGLLQSTLFQKYAAHRHTASLARIQVQQLSRRKIAVQQSCRRTNCVLALTLP